jgi:hypothetical protein
MCYGVDACYFYQYVKPDVDHLEKVELCEEWAAGVEAHLKAFYDEFQAESRNPAKWLEAVVKQQTEDEPRNPYSDSDLMALTDFATLSAKTQNDLSTAMRRILD